MEKEIDPSDIGKYPAVIKMAQSEMTLTDVLVCGKCHTVFHFIELFKEHKNQGCIKDSSLRDCRETKPKVWAFLLWKASQLNSEECANVNSWKLYQTWVKMDEAVRETWVVAGRTIQSFGKMGQGSLQEMPVKITKTVVDSPTESSPEVKKVGGASVNKLIKRGIEVKSMPKAEEKNDDDVHTFIQNDIKEIKKPILNRVAGILPKIQTTPTTQVIANKSRLESRLAKRTAANGIEVEEHNIEKILAKRFNPRRKQYEYLVKWENMSHELNTWEQLSHFETCQHLLDHFETQLAKQKEQRAKFQQEQQAKTAAILASPTSTVLSPNRPTRNSKSKAIDQVKQWCADEDGVTITLKRKSLNSENDEGDDDPDEDFSFSPKKIKTDNPAVAEALMKAGQSGNVRIVQVNKASGLTTNITQKTLNGSTISTNDLSNNKNSAEIVITNTKDGKTPTGVVKKPGVTNSTTKTEAQVRVIPKGETITSGVVRINKPAQQPPQPSKLINMGQQKGPKNPTHITTVKPLQNRPKPIQQKIAGMQQLATKRFSLSPETTQVHSKTTITRIVKSTPPKPEQKNTPKQEVKVIRKFPVVSAKEVPKNPFILDSKDEDNDDDDEDDGFTDPFPTEITAPETDEGPPLPLTLCPITGKVLGKAEGERTPLPSPEPSPDLKKIEVKSKVKEEPAQIKNENVNEDSIGEDTQVQQLQPITNEDGTPLIVTGEDGTIYQVAGKNAEGQTILIAQGADGEQQCVYVAAQEGDEDLGIDQSTSDSQQMISQDSMEDEQTQYVLKEESGSDPTQILTLAMDGNDSQDGQITAEVVQADLPSPGGTRRVVLLLPDGNFMMTEVDEEQYRSLNLVS